MSGSKWKAEVGMGNAEGGMNPINCKVNSINPIKKIGV